MMKNIINRLIILALFMGSIVSCDYDPTEFDALTDAPDSNATYYVQFQGTEESFATDFDSAGDVTEIVTTIGVKLLGLPRSEDITINLGIDGSSTAQPNMYAIGTTSLVIPAGSVTASTSFTSVADNIPIGETVALVINLDAGGNSAPFGTQLVYNLTRTAPCAWLPGIYTIEMFDSYGDGWQTTGGLGGDGMTIEIDGVVTEFGMCTPYEPSPYTCTQGADDFSATTTVEIPDGAISVKWTFPGDRYGEISFNILDPNGVTIYSVATGGGVAGELVFDEALVCTNL